MHQLCVLSVYCGKYPLSHGKVAQFVSILIVSSGNSQGFVSLCADLPGESFSLLFTISPKNHNQSQKSHFK